MKKRVAQIVGAIMLALAIALTQIPVSFVQAVSSNSQFERKENKLISYTGTAEAVSVPSGTKIICEDAFAGNHHIKEVTLPDSVEVIENGAFRNCDQLQKVKLNNGLVEIGSGAFSLCEKLPYFRLSDTVLKIGAGVFAGDSKLTGIDVGKNPYFQCENGVLYNREKTKLIQYFATYKAEEYTMPDSVNEIERYAFWGCKNLEEVNLSSYLYSIPEFAFSNCRDLKKVTIPYSVRAIDAKAFEDCVRLKTISLPISVTQIHPTAFDGCRGIRIIAEDGSYAQTFYSVLKEKQIQEEASVSGNAMQNPIVGQLFGEEQTSESKDSFEDVDLDDEKILEVGRYNPLNPADVSKLDVSEYYGQDGTDLIGKARVVGNQAVILAKVDHQKNADVSETGTVSFEPDTEIQDDGSHKIFKKAFYQDQTLNHIVLQDGIEEIEDFAFSRSSLKGIQIPNGVKKIGYGAFYHCDDLAYVEIPKSVTDIMPQAFEQTAYLEEWKKSSGSDFLIVGDGILIGYKGLQGIVTLPANVKKIAGNVFTDHTEINKVNFNEQLVEIGEEAFAGCSNLSSFSGAGHIRKIADRAFRGCPLKQIHIGNNVEKIGLSAFLNTTADAVVFESIDRLPKLSYEQTATRYENAVYRDNPFGNVSVAVIQAKVADDYTDTILDERCLGFKGLTISLPNGKEGTPKVAKIEYCTMVPQKDSVTIKIPNTVTVDGVIYSIVEADMNAFSPYSHLGEWFEGSVSAIILPDALGQIQDYEPELVLGAENSNSSAVNQQDDVSQTETVESESQNTETSETKSSTTTINVGSSYPSADLIMAEVLDDTNPYTLYVGSSDAEYDLQDAVANRYGDLQTGQLSTFDLKLVENATNIPITNIGENQMKIQIPISETYMNQDICVVSLDSQNMLQMHFGSKDRMEDGCFFTFYTNHFSPYGLYVGIGDTAELIRKQSALLTTLDESPDTGEQRNPFIILAIGFACLGSIFLMNGFRKTNHM